MKLRALFPLIVVACLQLSVGPLLAQKKRTPAAAPPAVESNEKAWKIFLSADGRFSALLPGSPVKSGQVVSTGVGPLPSFYFNLKTGMAEYHISYMDFPSAFDDPAVLKIAYDTGRDETLATNKLSLVNDREVTVQGHIGRHITALGKDRLFNHRIVAVGKRLYQVAIVTRDYRKLPLARIKFFESVINKFLDSFKLVNGDNGASSVAETTNDVGAVDLGRTENSVYINDYFHFRVSLPESWPALEREISDAALNVSKEMVKGTDTEANEEIDRSIAKTFVLFTITKFALRTPNVTQAMFQCGVERLSDKRMTALVYLEKNRDFLLATPLQYKLRRDVYPETIAGVNFAVMDMQQTAGALTIKQKYYATIRKEHALFFVTNYFDEADGVTMANIIQTVKFE